MGQEVLQPTVMHNLHAPNVPAGLHAHYGLDAGTIQRLSKRASVGDELIWCAQCKGDLIII